VIFVTCRKPVENVREKFCRARATLLSQGGFSFSLIQSKRTYLKKKKLTMANAQLSIGRTAPSKKPLRRKILT
jgi:hypothetical protein